METVLENIELSPTETVCAGWIHAFGVYYPRHQAVEHQQSAWSQAVIRAKRKSGRVIEHFGRMIALHLERSLRADVPYVITHVPAEPDRERYLFGGLTQCATEILAACLYAHLMREDVTLDVLLTQIAPKAKKQHQCRTLAERHENVRDVYAVSDPQRVAQRHIVLVDDVLTSGATMNACATVLRQAGALSVTGIALAQTVRLKPLPTMTAIVEQPETIGACAI